MCQYYHHTGSLLYTIQHVYNQYYPCYHYLRKWYREYHLHSYMYDIFLH